MVNWMVTAGQDADYLDLGLRLPLPDGGKQETNAFHDLIVIVDSDVIRADHQYYFLSLVSIQFTMIDSPKYEVASRRRQENESLFSDGLHPNEEGYKQIVDEIAH